MAKTLFHKPRCSSCEYYGVHNESVPKKVAGAFLRVIVPVGRGSGYLSVLIQRYIFLRGVRVVRSRLSCAFIAIRIPMLGS